MHKKAIAVVISLSLCLLCSCTNQQSPNIPELVQGGYREQVIDSFPNLSYVAGMDMVDGDLYVFGSTSEFINQDFEMDKTMYPYFYYTNPWQLWTSKDGYRWEQIEMPWFTEPLYISSASFDTDGRVYFTYTTDIDDPDTNLTLAYGNELGWDNIAVLSDLFDYNILYNASLTVYDEDHFIIAGSKASLEYIDTDSNITTTLSTKGDVGTTNIMTRGTFSISENQLSMCMADHILVYDLITGNPIVDLPHPISLAETQYVFCSDGNAGYYVCDQSGLYRIAPDGSIVEQLANGSYYSFGSGDRQIEQLFNTGPNTFFMLSITNGIYQLSSLSLDQDSYRAPERELQIYSLYDSTAVQELIRGYRQQAPDVLVTHRVGITDDSVAVEDALDTLTTELNAGAGPDILVLDGIPFANYSNQLLDISGLLDESSQTNNLLTGITKAYQTEQGIHAVPTTFSVPVLVGYDMEAIASVQDLIQHIEQLDEAFPQITDYNLQVWYYPVASGQWIKENGKWDDVAIAQGLDQWMRLNNVLTAGLRTSSVDIRSISYYMSGESPFILGNIGSLEDYSYIITALNQRQSGEVITMPGVAGDVFVPHTILGINASSTYLEDTQGFLHYALSQEGQSMFVHGGGWPVNMDAIEEEWSQREAGSVLMEHITPYESEWRIFNILWPDEDEYAQLLQLFEELGTPSANDELLRLYFYDQISVDAG